MNLSVKTDKKLKAVWQVIGGRESLYADKLHKSREIPKFV